MKRCDPFTEQVLPFRFSGPDEEAAEEDSGIEDQVEQPVEGFEGVPATTKTPSLTKLLADDARRRAAQQADDEKPN